MKKVSILIALLCVEVFAQEKGTFKDARDGKIYKYVKIGTQTWMAENLNFKTSGGSLCCHDYNLDKKSFCEKYGRLYLWNAAIKACPNGWHLPSRNEWSNLVKIYALREACEGRCSRCVCTEPRSSPTR